MSIIELKDVSFIYGKKTPYEIKALDNVNLNIEENLITGLIGHTGSGKSTLVQLLNGLLKPSFGTVFVDGEDIWKKPKKIGQVRFKVGMVMQYPEYQLFADTVWEDIAYGPKNMKLSNEEIEIRVQKSIEFCGLDKEILSKSPFDLSGGQKRRVALAGVMAMNPKILILDEPAAGLDPKGRREILGGIKRYREESGTTVIIVSHSMEDMAMYCDRVVVMSKSKLLLNGTCKEVFSQHQLLKENGLDVPEITNIVLKLREKGINIPSDIYTVEGAIEAICKSLTSNAEKEVKNGI
ncbi:MAG: energy-coupling factor transporter ATPase [Ruminococcaceae bacterium]|nr:energy-coupling factor transporter ATPase [Oscillospiraceae bacterium]